MVYGLTAIFALLITGTPNSPRALQLALKLNF